MNGWKDVPRHGTATGYKLGCRCEDCTGHHREYMRHRRGSALAGAGLPAVSKETYNAAVRELVFRHTAELRAIVAELGEVS